MESNLLAKSHSCADKKAQEYWYLVGIGKIIKEAIIMIDLLL